MFLALVALKGSGKWNKYSKRASVCVFVTSAGGAADSKRNGAEPSTAADPERDRAEEGQDSGIGSLWNRLQGQHASRHLQVPHSNLQPNYKSNIEEINEAESFLQ